MTCFDKAGFSREDAEVTTRLLVDSDLRGVRSHGIRYAPSYCQGYIDGIYNPQPKIKVVNQTPTAVVIDGDGGLGYRPMVEATNLAITKAKELGLGMGLVRHIGHFGAAGHYTRICAERGCIGLSTQGYRHAAEPSTKHPKPSVASIGKPPICFAFPSGDEPPIVLDTVAHLFSHYMGKEYDDLSSRIPGVFFKSIGFIAIAQIMGGPLTGFTMPESDNMVSRWPGADLGAVILAIDIEQVVPRNVFDSEVDRYVKAVRENYAPVAGYDQALLPGAIEEETMERQRLEGIRFGQMEQQSAKKLHDQFGVTLPWE